jgi:hypothetical protein
MREVRHPHLLSTFGAWQKDNVLLIAMELADRTLLERFQEAVSQGHPAIPAHELIQHFEDASEGIDFLNESCHALEGRDTLGIQHRDIKPQNLLLVGGRVKVADFGLARVLTHTVTGHTGSLTPAYAAPEFFNGQTFRQSDQYSLAVTYCHLRGGRLPYTGTPAQIMAGHLLRPPDLTMLPENERPAVLRALAKRPEDRWPSSRAFVAEVAMAVELSEQEEVGAAASTRTVQRSEKAGESPTGIPTPEPTPRPGKKIVLGPTLSPRSKKRAILATAVVLALLALAGVIALFVQPRPATYLVAWTPQNFDAVAFTPRCNQMVHGKPTPHGLGLHPREKSWAYVAYDLQGQFQVFQTAAGLADSADHGEPEEGVGPFTFTVSGDGKLLWQSQPHQQPGQLEPCEVSIEGISQLLLQVHCPGGVGHAEPVWVEPRLLGQRVFPPDFPPTPDEAERYEQAIALCVREGEIDKAANLVDQYAFLKEDEVPLLLGTWTVEVEDHFRTEWTFRADGTVHSMQGVLKGRWEVDKERRQVHLAWDAAGAWDSLALPLNPRQTHGTTSRGRGLRLKAAKTQDPRAVTLLGTWFVLVGPYTNEITFSADGKVAATSNVTTGKWKFEKQNKHILIPWDGTTAWERFDLPLNPKGTAGGTWHSKDFSVRAVKLTDSWAEQFAWQTPATFLVDFSPRHVEAAAFGPSPDTILNGKPTRHGLALHPPQKGRAYVAYALNQRFELFRTMAAIRNSANARGGSASPLNFRVLGDGKLLWQSQPLQKGGQTEACEVPVSGVSELVLQVDCPGSADFAHAFWVEPCLYR